MTSFELKLTGIRTPNYNRRADLVCFVNGLPLVFIELKAVYKNIREGFDNNLSDYMDENVIAHAFHHNVCVSNSQFSRRGARAPASRPRRRGWCRSGGPVRLEFVVRPPLGAGPSPGSGRPNGHCSARHGPPMCPPAKVNSVWPFNDAWLRTSLS